jgi:DegV family protein with EDD domain
MAPKIAVVTDSSAFIPAEESQGLDIHVIPLWMFWDGDRIQDGVDLTPEQFYARLKASDTIPTSSQPSAGEFSEFFKRLAPQYDGIAAVLVSSQLSGTVASAQAAVEDLPDIPIEVVDTLGVSMSLGFCVLAAAKKAADGGSLEDVAEAARRMSKRVHFLFVVDTLEYLHKGGRIGGAKALFGTALSIKPLLHFLDGRIEPLMQVRTKKKAIQTMLEQAAERLDGRQMVEAALLDIDVPEEGDRVAEMVAAAFPGVRLIRSTVSPVVGTHAGPGTIGLAFFGEE